MTARSDRPEVRNPVLGLPAAAALLGLPPETRAILARLHYELAADARARAELSWRRNKAPMAVYWKAVAVYARHIARTLQPRSVQVLAQDRADCAFEACERILRDTHGHDTRTVWLAHHAVGLAGPLPAPDRPRGLRREPDGGT
jgi:hypothetical protein